MSEVVHTQIEAIRKALATLRFEVGAGAASDAEDALDALVARIEQPAAECTGASFADLPDIRQRWEERLADRHGKPYRWFDHTLAQFGHEALHKDIPALLAIIDEYGVLLDAWRTAADDDSGDLEPA